MSESIKFLHLKSPSNYRISRYMVFEVAVQVLIRISSRIMIAFLQLLDSCLEDVERLHDCLSKSINSDPPHLSDINLRAVERQSCPESPFSSQYDMRSVICIFFALASSQTLSYTSPEYTSLMVFLDPESFVSAVTSLFIRVKNIDDLDLLSCIITTLGTYTREQIQVFGVLYCSECCFEGVAVKR